MADSDYSAGQMEGDEGLENSVARWDAELKLYEKAAKSWHDSFDRITDRYALEGRADQLEAEFGDESKFNVLWSNIQTMLPALFAREPIPSVMRRHKDPDPIGRLAAETLERAVSTEMEDDNLMDVFERVVLDTLIGGRGVPWVRYDADISRTDVPLTVDNDEGGNISKRYRDPDGNEDVSGRSGAGFRDRIWPGAARRRREHGARPGRLRVLAGLRAQAGANVGGAMPRRVGGPQGPHDPQAGRQAIRRQVQERPAERQAGGAFRQPVRTHGLHHGDGGRVGNLVHGHKEGQVAVPRVPGVVARRRERPAEATQIFPGARARPTGR